MDKFWALAVIQIWLLVMLYGWFANKDGRTDRRNFDRFHKSSWTRWMLSGQSRAAFLHQRSRLHKMTLPFVAVFYLLAMCGALLF